MVYYSRRQCSNPDDCADAQTSTPSPTVVERVLNTISSAPDDHKILRAYVILAANLILFLALARAGYRALTRPWRDRQYRELKKIFFFAPSKCRIDLSGPMSDPNDTRTAPWRSSLDPRRR